MRFIHEILVCTRAHFNSRMLNYVLTPPVPWDMCVYVCVFTHYTYMYTYVCVYICTHICMHIKGFIIVYIVQAQREYYIIGT